MKRPWFYVASFIPFTVATNNYSKGAPAEDDPSQFKKNNGLADGEEEHDKNGQGSSDDGSGALSHGIDFGSSAYNDDGQNGHGGGMSPAGAHGSGPLLHENGGMFAPSALSGEGAIYIGGMSGYGGGGGGGSSSLKKVLMKLDSSEGQTPTGDEENPGNGGYVESDPADEDAMMLLLGGIAEGTGSGASSEGEVVFDIVDYGSITIGYGYSTFMASGNDGAYADTFYNVSGADLVFSYETGFSHGNFAQSSTHVLAIDFEDESMFGQTQLSSFDWLSLLKDGPFSQDVLGEEEDVSVDGNIAVMSATGEVSDAGSFLLATGSTNTYDGVGSVVITWLQSQQATLAIGGEAESVESLASATGSLLEIEDHYSSVSGVGIGIA